MRPLQLRMTAFGPFAEPQLIDFERLGSAALFLIEGTTGAGKTTILDAICYALYDRSTGGERDARRMRSDFAQADVLTEVELVFALGDARYRIRRVPEQERPRQRGTGVTRQAPTAELCRLDGPDETVLVARKVGDANAAITQLTGLTVEQFRQVMVLPQGQFRRLLTAESKDRQAILQNLFGTALYSDVAERLKRLSGELAGRDRDIGIRLDAAWQSIGLPPESDIDALITETRLEAGAQRERRHAAEAALHTAVEALADAERLAAAHAALRVADDAHRTAQLALPAHRKREAVLVELEAVDALQPTWQAWQQAIADLDVVTRDEQAQSAALARSQATRAEAEAQASGAQRDHERRDGLVAEAQRMAGLLPQLEALESATADVQRAAVEVVDAERARTLADTEHAALVEALQAQRDTVLVAERAALRVPELRNQLDSWTRMAAARAQRASIGEAIERQRGELDRARQQASTAAQLLERAAALREQGERVSATQHALELAASLTPQSPCPVCGSRDHPEPAGAQRELLDPALVDLDALHRNERDATVNHRDAVHDTRAIESRIDALVEQQRGLDVLTAGVDDTAQRSLETELVELRTVASGLDTARAAVVSTEHALVAIGDTRRAADERHRQVLQVLAAAQQQQRQLVAAFGDAVPERAAVLARLVAVNAEREAIEAASVRAQQALETAGLRLAEAAARHDSLRALRMRREHDCASHEASWLHALSASPFAEVNDFRVALGKLDSRDALHAESLAFEQQLRDLEAERGALRTLVDGRPAPALERLQRRVDSARQEFDSCAARLATVQARLAQLDQADKTVAKLRSEREAVTSRYRVLGRLSQAANGQNALRLNLQSFVLSVLLDDVLIAADERLLRMTRGRYRLVRREGVTHGGRQAGLDLDVDDAHTGRRRQADTLSGGESFLAALALALGLSDVVQAHAGGIRLDTLFIDEGFGSLDPEALDLAVSALVDLQSSGRLIGVISHVPELREQIQAKLAVRACASGSHATLTVNPGARAVT
ncbi:MAG: SMC family ATPase [Pseudomonadota bacterium]